jgi:hypothetical protein
MEGQRIYGRATNRDKGSARVNRQSKGRAARFFTYTPFVITGPIIPDVFIPDLIVAGVVVVGLVMLGVAMVGSLREVLLRGPEVQTGHCRDAQAHWMATLYCGINDPLQAAPATPAPVVQLQNSIFRSSLSDSLSALTHELTESGDPAGFLASPAGFFARVGPDTNTSDCEALVRSKPRKLNSP